MHTHHIHLPFLILTKELFSEMKQVLDVINRIYSQRSATHLLLNTSNKAVVDECDREMALACGIFGVRKPDNLSICSCQILVNQIRYKFRSSHNKPSLGLRLS